MNTSLVTSLADGTVVRLEIDGSYLGAQRFERFFEVLEASAAVRAERQLSPARMAVLAMLDELRGLFVTGEIAAARRLGERCFLDLQAAFGEPAASVARPVTREPRILGWLVEYAIARALTDPGETVARVRALLQLAADLDGGPRSPLETRPDRVRRQLFESDVEPIALPLPAVHPARWDAVAAHLGTTVDDAREQLEFAEDARDRVAALSPSLLVRAVPRIPLEERPARVYPPHDRFGAAVTVEDPLTIALNAVIALGPYATCVLDPHAAPHLAMFLQSRVHRSVAQLAEAAVTDDDPFLGTAWGPPLGGHGDDEEKLVDTGNTAAPSCVWLAEDTAVFAVDGIARVRSLSTGDELRVFSIGDLRLQACDDTGRFVLVGPVGLVDYLPGTGFACRDLEAEAWVDPPPELAPVSYLLALHEPDPDDDRTQCASLVNFRTGACIDLEPPEDLDASFARGNRGVLLLRHGLRATETGFIEIAPAILAARTADEAPVVHHATPPDLRVIGPTTACARGGDRWRFLLPNGNVAEGDRTLVRIGWTIWAASFSPDGRRLLVLGEHDAVIVDLERATVIAVPTGSR